MENDILKYIKKRWGTNKYIDEKLMDFLWAGNCLQFALLLQNRFPSTQIGFFETPRDNYPVHFVVYDNKNFYDVHGIYYPRDFNGPFTLLDDFIETNPIEAQKLLEELWG